MKAKRMLVGGSVAVMVLGLLPGIVNSADVAEGNPSANPRIEILKVPSASVKPGTDDTGEIRGKVSGLPSFKGYCVVVYAKGGQLWWVQPNTSKPTIVIDRNGEFSADVFGGTVYVALLVKDTYKPQPKLKLEDLPSVGDEVLARDRKEPEKTEK